MDRRDGMTGAAPRALAVVLLVTGACFGRDPDRPRLPPAPESDPARGTLSDPRVVLYDASGALLPSDQKVAGLPLPRGLDVVREDGRDHVYATRAPLQKVQAYFGPRLETTDVTRIGAGVLYQAAVPRGVRGGQVKLDVSILPGTDGKVRVQIVELPPPPPPLDDDARRALFERVQREAPVLD